MGEISSLKENHFFFFFFANSSLAIIIKTGLETNIDLTEVSDLISKAFFQLSSNLYKQRKISTFKTSSHGIVEAA